jgi:acetyltransferase-like isoleucine patch superfamily enzyme
MRRGINLLRKVFRNIALWFAGILTIEYPRKLTGIKNRLLKFAGMKLQHPAFIDRGFRCINPDKIEIGSHVSLGHDNHIWAFSPVKIGQYTQTAKDLLIIAGSHDVASFKSLPNQDVTIGPGCWIGAKVTILGGVKIGKGCVIGAGSLVQKDIPDWSVAVGVPARVIRKREPAQKIVNPFGIYSPEDLESI